MRADQLREGERLRSLHGTSRVIGLTLRSGRHTVYNLEVQAEHVYHVGSSGLLVHNGGLAALNPCYKPNFNKIPQELLDAAERNVTDSGTTVLGHLRPPDGYPVYMSFRQNL